MPPASAPQPQQPMEVLTHHREASGTDLGLETIANLTSTETDHHLDPPPPIDRGNKINRTKLWCSHYGMQKHTRETCFQIVGNRDWWEEKQKAKGKLAIRLEKPKGCFATAVTDVSTGGEGGRYDGGGRSDVGERAEAMQAWTRKKDNSASVGGKGFGTPNPNLTLLLQFKPPRALLFQKVPHSHNIKKSASLCSRNDQTSPSSRGNHEISLVVSKNRFAILEKMCDAFKMQSENKTKETGWIFDCWATDTMTHDKSDFISFSEDTKTQIQTANGEITTAVWSGTIEISPTLRLSNYFYVPTLSHKLMSLAM